MKVLIFDMDGVLIDTMPFHYVVMKMAIKEVSYIDLDKRTFYLLEGDENRFRNPTFVYQP